MPTTSAASRALYLAGLAYDEDSPNAAPLLEKAIEKCKTAGCTASPQYTSALCQLAELRVSLGDHSQALCIADEAVALLMTLDENDMAVQGKLALCDNARGNALGQLGREGESLLAHQASLRRHELMGDASGSIAALSNIGELLKVAGRYADALQHLRLAEARAQASPVEFAGQLAVLPRSLGDVLACLGRYAEAAESLRRSKARSVSVFGRRSPQVIAVCTSLAAALISLEDYTGAAEQLREAEVICALRGWKDLEGGDMHARFGDFAMKQGRFQDALARYELSLSSRRRFFQADHPLLSMAIYNIGLAQAALGMDDEARLSQKAAAQSFRRSQTFCAGPGCMLQQRPDGTPLDQCAGCLCTYYCSVACQTADWKRQGGHKAECRVLAAEGRAAAVAAPG